MRSRAYSSARDARNAIPLGMVAVHLSCKAEKSSCSRIRKLDSVAQALESNPIADTADAVRQSNL